MQRSVIMLTTLLCGCALAEPRQLRLKWDELPAAITDKKVAFVLPDGTHVEGKVLAVEPDGLRMKVAKSSDRSTQPKGMHLVPRQAVSLLRVTDYHKMGRLLGTAGAVALTAGIAAASYPDIYEGPLLIIVPSVMAGGIAGSAVGGYYAGKAFDKKVTEIRIVPDGKE